MTLEKTLEGYQTYLRENTTMEETTIRQYVYAVRRFLNETNGISTESINHFISENTRLKFNYQYKYALKQYLVFSGRKDLLEGIVKIKIKPRKKTGNYYGPETIWQIINKLQHYRTPAIIQYVTGARPREALMVEKDKVIKTNKGIRIILTGKGGQESEVMAPPPYSDYIFDETHKTKDKFPFLRGSSVNMLLWVNTNYRYYLREIFPACQELGVRFSPHDFRRNFAEEINQLTGGNTWKLKLAMRHKRITSTEGYVKQVIDPELQVKYVERIGGGYGLQS